MREFKSVSLADQVFEKLESDIITGVYPRGEVLTELKLVENLGVKPKDIKRALDLAVEYREEFIQKWNEFHN